MRYLLLFLFCVNLNAQLIIADTEYVLLSDMGVDRINTPRANGSNRFDDLVWNEIDKGDLTSIVKAFVRDAVTHGGDLDLSDRHILELRPATFWNDPRIGGSSYGSTNPGYHILLNQDIWNDLNGINKVLLVYHELGHGLLHAGHICHSYGGIANAIMSTATCLVNRGGPGLSPTPYRLDTIEGLIDHLYDTLIILPDSQARKGPDIIND